MRPYAALARLALLVLAMPLWSVAAAQTAPPPADVNTAARSAIRLCIDRIDEKQVGLPELEMRCPDLSPALQAAGIRPLIIDSSRAEFDRYSLRRLSTLIHPAAGPAPAVAALAPILRGLHPMLAPSRSWWRRLLDWLNEHLAPQRQPNSSYPWLDGILRLLPRLQWLWTAIIWGTVIALPVGVVVIVVREVRAMGRRSTDNLLTATERALAGPHESRLARLRQLPLEQRPAQLFAMLISRLVAAGRLPPDRSLTHREIATRAVVDDADQRRLLESLARCSERQLYFRGANAPAGLDELIARGEDLYTTGWGRPVVD